MIVLHTTTPSISPPGVKLVATAHHGGQRVSAQTIMAERHFLGDPAKVAQHWRILGDRVRLKLGLPYV